MGALISAVILFVGMHFLFSDRHIRPKLVAALGEKLFSGLYSVIAGAALVWMIWAYAQAPVIPLHGFGASPNWIALPVVALALLFIVCGNSQYNPTAVARQIDLARVDPAPGILKITRHPVMWGIGLFASVHLLVNFHLAALVFFGGIALLALLGTLRLDAKHRRRDHDGFTRLAAATSNLPFLAIVAGRQRLGAAISGIGGARFAIAAALFLGLLFAHPWIAGRAVAIF